MVDAIALLMTYTERRHVQSEEMRKDAHDRASQRNIRTAISQAFLSAILEYQVYVSYGATIRVNLECDCDTIPLA